MNRLACFCFAALLVGCATNHGNVTAPTSQRPEGLAFIEDDYSRALALARARGIPIFIDAWAPW
jgi:hypothetical protein